MIKTLIIEDEIAGQELLKKNLLEYFPDCEVVAVVDHVDKAVREINALQPDLVFVDVHIKGGTGFDILSRFRNRRFEVIFITAYDQYAIQAIKEETLDYMLKPINANEFKKGVSKAIEKINRKAAAPAAALLKIATYTGIEFISSDEIVFLEAEGSYTSIQMAGSKVLSTKNIGEYESLLAGHSFFRSHHSFIVNTTHIEKFNKGRTGILIMKTGHVIPVSQRRMKDFSELMNMY